MWPTLTTSNPTDWRAAAVLAVRRYCGWHVAPVFEETVTLDGSGQSALILPTKRLVRLVTVVEDGTELDVSTLEASQTGIVRKPKGPWTRKLGGIEVTMEHGYEEYDDLVAVVDTVAARARATGAGVVQQGAGPFSVRRGTGADGGVLSVPLLQSEKDLLQPYRLTWGV